MFKDMGELPLELFESFRVQSRDKLQSMFERGDYIGWLASPENEPARIVAGAGYNCAKCPHIRKPTRTVRSTLSQAGRRSSKMFTPNRNGGGGGWPPS
jgi:hypothetical protein